MNQAVLYVFAISHYCEKARWALDYQGVDYKLVHLAPGAHRALFKKYGLSTSSVPKLRLQTSSDDLWLEDSDAILGWSEEQKASLAPSLNEAADLDLEQRLNSVLGVHVRRFFYSEAIVDYPETVLPMFIRDLSFMQRLIVRVSWGTIRKIMIQRMDLGAEQGLDSRERVAAELDYLDTLLADGRTFLTGDTFNRTDITAASLLSPLVRPREHPSYANVHWTPKFAEDCESWQDRPCLQWAKRVYRDHRLQKP